MKEDQREQRVLRAQDENDTKSIAFDIAGRLKAGDVIALTGDLGTGKTTFTKYLAQGLGIDHNINSPTFNIVKEHYGGRLPLYHFDVYRLGSGEELIDAGAEDYFYGDGVSVVEWADLVMDYLPEDAIVIHISYGEKEGERVYICIF